MGKAFKLIIGLFLAGLLLLVAAVVIVPMMVDPNDYKDDIIAKVKEETGRTLEIPGELKMSVFPWLGVETGRIALSNPKGFAEQPFAEVNRVAVRIKLMPLLSRRLEVDTVGLDGLVLNLEKDQRGHTNWDDLAKGKDASDKDEHRGGGEGLSQFSIGGVDISDARISWNDASTGQQYLLDKFFLKSGAISSGRPVDLEMGMTLTSKAPEMQAVVKSEGTVALDQSAGMLSIDGLELTVDATGAGLPGGKASLNLQAGVKLALDGSMLAVDGLQMNSGDLQLAGSVKGTQLATTPAFSGELKLAEFNLREWLASFALPVPETADSAVLTKVGGDFKLASKGSATEISSLNLVLDDTKITGTGSLQGSAIAVNLAVDRIDLDRYLPPPSEAPEEKAPVTQQAAASGDEALFPVDTLRQLNVSGGISVGELTVKKLKAQQVKLKLRAKGGKISLDQSVGSFYQGGYNGRTDLNVAGKTPQLKVESHLKGVEAGPLLKDLTGKDKLDGKGQFNTALTSSGNSINAIKRGLNGNLDFRFEDGAVKGFNLAQTIRDTKAKFSGGSAGSSDVPQQTDFSELSGSAKITNGVLDNRDLHAKSPYLRVTGAGTVNLVKETLDYVVKTVIVSTAKGQGGEGLDDLKGVPIPVKLTGPYASPSYSVDWGQVLAGTQGAKLEEKKQEAKAKLDEKKQEVKQEVEDKLKDKLKGLFR